MAPFSATAATILVPTYMAQPLYPTFQSAINQALADALPNDTVVVPAGTYNAFIVISKVITLQGAGRGYTTINGSVVINEGATLNGFTFVHNSTYGVTYGVHLSAASDGARIENNIFFGVSP